MKRRAKLVAVKCKKEPKKTGGGPKEVDELTCVDSQILSILGDRATGLSSKFDDDNGEVFCRLTWHNN